jgi:hypothetical protein
MAGNGFSINGCNTGRREAPIQLAHRVAAWFIGEIGRIWWNWQTRYFEVVVPQGVQVQVLLCAPILKKGLHIQHLAFFIGPNPDAMQTRNQSG